MARLDHNTYRSLNESINRVQNPHAALNEALEYTAALEAALLALCEELDLAPDELFEMAQTYDRWRETKATQKMDEDYQTPSREREMLRKIKAAERGSDAASKQYIRAWDAEYKTPERNPKAVEASRVAGKKLAAASRKRDRLYATQRKEEMSRRLYGSRGKVLKRKVQEAAQLDERIIDEVDFFQASKNWITGKGFKTNREVVYDRVNKNYAAMKKREAAAAKAKKTK